MENSTQKSVDHIRTFFNVYTASLLRRNKYAANRGATTDGRTDERAVGMNVSSSASRHTVCATAVTIRQITCADQAGRPAGGRSSTQSAGGGGGAPVVLRKRTGRRITTATVGTDRPTDRPRYGRVVVYRRRRRGRRAVTAGRRLECTVGGRVTGVEAGARRAIASCWRTATHAIQTARIAVVVLYIYGRRTSAAVYRARALSLSETHSPIAQTDITKTRHAPSTSFGSTEANYIHTHALRRPRTAALNPLQYARSPSYHA